MIDDIDVKTVGFLITQIILITTVIVSNRESVRQLQATTSEIKAWLAKLQEKVTELRIKVGE